MLTHLTIHNFMLVEHLDLTISRGMTAITGETGTGKSIALEALGLALGERADGDKVRKGCEKTDITASFLVGELPEAKRWLKEHELELEGECLLRRVVTKEGRSRAFINGQPVPLQQLRAISEKLVTIHSQHAHQALLGKHQHYRILDNYGKHQSLAKQVKQAYHDWQEVQSQLVHLRENTDEANARFQLLQYQVEEFDQLALQENEPDELEQEQETLANAESLLAQGHQLGELCDEGDYSAKHQLHQALNILQSIRPQTEAFQSANELLSTAVIQIDEAYQQIRQQLDATEVNPERLQQVEERLSIIYTLARKHHINPGELLEKHRQLSDELAQISSGDDALLELESKAEQMKQAFSKLATALSEKRTKTANRLNKAVNKQLQKLAMQSANFTVGLSSNQEKPSAQGIDDLEFMISTNPGQAHKPLGKVVSGGELSRISLAIQVITAQTSDVATLIFDEVDVGIGGRTADTVGKLLTTLGEKAQVICITHLAQVASKAQQHWQVSKSTTKGKNTQSTILPLEGEEKVAEIARMISGEKLSKQSIAHARELLEEAS